MQIHPCILQFLLYIFFKKPPWPFPHPNGYPSTQTRFHPFLHFTPKVSPFRYLYTSGSSMLKSTEFKTCCFLSPIANDCEGMNLPFATSPINHPFLTYFKPERLKLFSGRMYTLP